MASATPERIVLLALMTANVPLVIIVYLALALLLLALPVAGHVQCLAAEAVRPARKPTARPIRSPAILNLAARRLTAAGAAGPAVPAPRLAAEERRPAREAVPIRRLSAAGRIARDRLP